MMVILHIPLLFIGRPVEPEEISFEVEYRRTVEGVYILDLNDVFFD